MVSKAELDNLRREIISRLAYAQRHIDEVPFGKILELHAALLSALPALEDDVTARSDYYKHLVIHSLRELIPFEEIPLADVYNNISSKTLYELGFRNHTSTVSVVSDGNCLSYQSLLDTLDENGPDGGLQQIPWSDAGSMSVFKFIRELTKANI